MSYGPHWSLRSPAGYEAPQIHAVSRDGPYSEDWRSACGMKATNWPKARVFGRDLKHVTCGRCLRRLEKMG